MRAWLMAERRAAWPRKRNIFKDSLLHSFCKDTTKEGKVHSYEKGQY